MGALGLGRECSAVHRRYLHLIHSRRLKDLAGKFIPAAQSFIGGMVNAVPVGLDHVHHQAGQIIGIGGRADLVIHYGYGSPFPPQTEHGLNKVFPVHAEYPGDADNKVFFQKLLYGQLAFVFRLAVNIQRLPGIIRLPGSFTLAVKHVVRAEIHHLNVQLPAHFGNVSRSFCIYLPAEVFVVLCRVYCRIGSAVDHCISLCFRDYPLTGSGIGNVHLFHIHANGLNSPFFTFLHHIIT